MQNNKTYSPKEKEIEKKWYIIDAAGKTVGKVATAAASILQGKHKPEFAYNVDVGDFVVVINCKELVLTGAKLDNKKYQKHSGYVGGLKTRTAKEMMEKQPAKVMYIAVKGMLPKNKLGTAQLKKLRVYAGSEHEQTAQKPEVWEVE